ncbi:MAG: DUF951 domain-containing protein [Candidatus Promineifilaceae bacterium]
MIVQVELGSLVQMRKQHPCGGYIWKVTRLGVDIGLECTTCQRQVKIPRSKFNKRVKKVLTHPTNDC